VRDGGPAEDPLHDAFDVLLNHPRTIDILGRLGSFLDHATRRGLDRQPKPEDSPHYQGPFNAYASEWPPRPEPAPDRSQRQRPRQPSTPSEDPRSVLGIQSGMPLTAQLVKRHQRALAAIHHPDVQGGSKAAMQRINAAVTALLAQCS